MGYMLEAIVADASLLEGSCGSLRHAVCVRLDRRLALIPLTGPLIDELTDSAAAAWAGTGLLQKLPAGADRLLALWSMEGPIAYLEADMWGGPPAYQSAAVWHQGTIVLAPRRAEIGPRHGPIHSWPINTALACLGLVPSGPVDLFEDVGLGRHSRTRAWLQDA